MRTRLHAHVTLLSISLYHSTSQHSAYKTSTLTAANSAKRPRLFNAALLLSLHTRLSTPFPPISSNNTPFFITPAQPYPPNPNPPHAPLLLLHPDIRNPIYSNLFLFSHLDRTLAPSLTYSRRRNGLRDQDLSTCASQPRAYKQLSRGGNVVYYVFHFSDEPHGNCRPQIHLLFACPHLRYSTTMQYRLQHTGVHI